MLNKKEKEEYLNDLEIVTREFLLGRDLSFNIVPEKNLDGLNVYAVGVEPSQFGLFGLEENGTFFGTILINTLANHRIKEGFSDKQITEEKTYKYFKTQEEFLEYICKPQTPLISNEN